MDVAQLVARYPRLFHMTEAGAWPSIERHGLCTAEQLVSGSASPAVAAELLGARRTAALRLDHPELGTVVVRDQLPLRPHILESRLAGVTAVEWMAELNRRVYFWLRPERLEDLLRARSYRGRAHDVLVVDTAGLVAAHLDRIELSPINSGATLWPNAAMRGRGTFLPIADYPFAQRLAARGAAGAIAELTVVDGVPDLVRHVVAVERREPA